MSEDEIEKLLRHGGDWIPDHPQKYLIVSRYLKKQGSLRRKALEQLEESLEIPEPTPNLEVTPPPSPPKEVPPPTEKVVENFAQNVMSEEALEKYFDLLLQT